MNIPVFVASEALLKQLTGYRLPWRYVCDASLGVAKCFDICAHARRVAVMENIVDFTNVGALMRSAAAGVLMLCSLPHHV